MLKLYLLNKFKRLITHKEHPAKDSNRHRVLYLETYLRQAYGFPLRIAIF
jgi:hypothetical protein